MTMTWPGQAPAVPWEATVSEPPAPAQQSNGGKQPAAPLASVWVAVVTVVTEILMRAPKVNTGNKSMGMDGLFAGVKAETVTQEHSAARVCGVTASEDEAKALLERWKARNGQVVIGDEMVVQVPFGVEADVGLEAAETRQCDGCGTVITFGLRCRACIDKYHEELRAKDADVLAEALAQKMAGPGGSTFAEWNRRVNGE